MAPAPPRLPDPARARACLLANLLILPGLGSVFGRCWTGWIQMGVALFGFGLTLWWLTTFCLEWISAGVFPATGGAQLGAGAVGALLFVGAWVWALATGLRLLRAARAAP